MHYDVIVAGAGPAGATAARHCTLAGLNTLVLDKDEFPRAKTCGGGLTLAAVRELGLPLPRAHQIQAVNTLRSYYGNHSRKVVRPDNFMFLIDRAAFDKFLLDQAIDAGAIFKTAAVQTITQDQCLTYVTTRHSTLTARYVIGADGVQSRAACHVRGPFSRYGKGFCLTAEVPVDNFPTPPPIGEINIHYGKVPLGYGWVFPKEKTALVGIGGISAALKNPRAVWSDFLCNLGIAGDSRLQVKGAFLPIGGLPRRVGRNRVLLAGDAAGFVEPFTGEGIKYAVRSGKLAAKAVIEGCRTNRPAIGYYRRLCAKAINRELQAAFKLSLLFFGCAGPMHRVFRSEPEYFRGLLDVLAGETDFTRFVTGLRLKLPFALLRSCF